MSIKDLPLVEKQEATAL